MNVILFYVSGLYRHVDGVGAGHDAILNIPIAGFHEPIFWYISVDNPPGGLYKGPAYLT